MFHKSRGGPKTALGKRRSSQNSRRHGIFASEFILSAADEVEYKKLSSGFREELGPNKAHLEVIFQDVLANAWRIKIGHRFEQQEVLKEFSIENEESSEKPQDVGSSFPHGMKPRKNEQAIRLLEELKAAVDGRGVLPAELEKEVTQAFGAELWKILTEWAPKDSVNIWISRLSEVAAERSELYGACATELTNVNSKEQKKYSDVFDRKHQEILSKIITIYSNILTSEHNHPAWGGGVFLDERASRLDLAMRYGTTARRDFYRSLREYWAAKDRG